MHLFTSFVSIIYHLVAKSVALVLGKINKSICGIACHKGELILL
jgi:hypothetical protein